MSILLRSSFLVRGRPICNYVFSMLTLRQPLRILWIDSLSSTQHTYFPRHRAVPVFPVALSAAAGVMKRPMREFPNLPVSYAPYRTVNTFPFLCFICCIHSLLQYFVCLGSLGTPPPPGISVLHSLHMLVPRVLLDPFLPTERSYVPTEQRGKPCSRQDIERKKRHW